MVLRALLILANENIYHNVAVLVMGSSCCSSHHRPNPDTAILYAQLLGQPWGYLPE